jgi:hypothetical protein
MNIVKKYKQVSSLCYSYPLELQLPNTVVDKPDVDVDEELTDHLDQEKSHYTNVLI